MKPYPLADNNLILFYINAIKSARHVLILFFMAITMIGLFSFSIYKTINNNWIGLTLQPNSNGYGIQIVKIHSKKLQESLNPGDIIVALRNTHIGTVAVDSETIRARPSIYSRGSIKRYDDFLENEERLYNLLKSHTVELVLINGKHVTVDVEQRPFFSIPFNFWFQLLCAISALVIGYQVFTKRRIATVTLHYIAAIVGYYIMACSWAIVMNRPLAISGDLYRYLDVLSHFGIGLIITGMLSLVWVYPRKLEPTWVPIAIYTGYLFFWLIDTLHLMDSLAFAFYSPLFFSFALATTFAVMQWKATEKLPADRTVLKWIFFFIYTASSFIMFFVFIPRTLGSFTLVSPNVEYLLAIFIFIGLGLAITRDRMVNLEFWWSIMWGGYFAITIIALVYFILITTVELDHTMAFAIALFFGAITFYPFRQWVKSRVKTAPQNELDKFLPTLVDILFTARTNLSLSQQWESILSRIFNPITLTSRKNPVAEAQIDNNGVVLRVPDFLPEYAIELAYSNQGKRLFVQEDVQLAQTMYELTKKAIHLNEARNKGAEDERQRIVRDLHDDVGAKLITIIHRAGTTQVADLCRSALQDIRDIMSYLGGGMYPLLAMIADWRNEVNARCEAAGINAVWQQQHAIPNFDIDSRTRMNLTRVMRESVTNAIKHAEPTELNIGIDYLDKQFYVTVMDDGKAVDIDQFIKGRGLHNMRDRMQEINGSIEWLQNQPHGCIVNISFSLSGEETK